MSGKSTNTPAQPRQVQELEVDEIIAAVWETAARRNPMVLVNMIDPHTAFEHLRRMIRDCLAKGLSTLETRDHAVKELLQSAMWNTQPQDTCHEPASQDERDAPSVS
jgi:hypothetical protein